MSKPRIHYLQHVDFEDLGFIEVWALEKNIALSVTKFYEEHRLPELASFDWLIIMGGPMGVYDDEDYPWLKEEKAFIKKAIDHGKIVIGICLGAQLIASALGMKVYPNVKKEIGWFPIKKTALGQQHNILSSIPDEFVAFHWHGDTFDIPKGALHLFKTDVCPHQGFIYKDKVVGLQFHLEVNTETLKSMVKNCRHELIEDEFVQNETEIVEQEILCDSSNLYLSTMLNRLLG